MWRTHNRVEVFSRITSFRFSGIKGNTGKGFGVIGQISSTENPQKPKQVGTEGAGSSSAGDRGMWASQKP